MDYYNKYLKYKQKYLQLKKSNADLVMKGGGVNWLKELDKKLKLLYPNRGKKNNMKELKKQFKLLIPKIKNFEIYIEPFLNKKGDDGWKIDKKIKKIFIERVSKNYKNMISEIFQIYPYKYKYDEITNKICIIYKPSLSDFTYIFRPSMKYIPILDLNIIIDLYNDEFLDRVKTGGDTWQSGEAYIKKNEVDNYEYLFNAEFIDLTYNLEKDNNKRK